MCLFKLFTSGTEVASSYANFSEQESVFIRKEVKSHRIGLAHQHGRRHIVLEHQYGRSNVM